MTVGQIYINARFLTQSLTGVQRYALELVKAIDQLIDCDDPAIKGYEFQLLAPQGDIHAVNLKHIKVKQVGRLSGHLWEQVELPIHSWGGTLLNLCNTAPIMKRNQAVMMHDAAVYAAPQTYSLAFRTWYKFLFRVLGVTSKLILTCSQFSKKQLMEHCKIKESKLQMIYHGKEHMLSVNADPDYIAKSKLDRPYVLAVSSRSPNKNFGSIIEAIKLIKGADFDIVIAGGTNPKVFNTAGISDAETEDNLSHAVKYLGYVEEEELRALYDHAACFVFPSFYEGFGFPPLEAMACGCPVIASNAASMPEVCGDAVLYCNPHSPQDIADKIALLMSDSALREELSQRGLIQAENFSWSKCARETLNAVYLGLDTNGVRIEFERDVRQ